MTEIPDNIEVQRLTNLISPWPEVRPTSGERSDASSSGGLIPTSYADPEWRVGWTDGRVGPELRLHASLFELMAKRLAAERAEQLRTMLENATAELTKTHALYERAADDAKHVEDAYRQLDNDRMASPTSFSLPLGLFYLIVAFVLFLADIPLSLLAADGLGMNVESRSITDLTILRTQWTASWEPLAFVLGIAALGLFFKFIADFFFKPKYARNRLMKAIAALTLLAVLALVITNLIFLARVRTSVIAMDAAARASQMGTEVDLAALQNDNQRWADRSFICLTLTLPMLGGICASAGWSRIQNSRRVRTLHALRSAMRTAVDAARAPFAEANSRHRITTESLSHVNDFIPQTAGLAFALYQHGFVRGFAVPETLHGDLSLRERVMLAMKRWLAIAVQRESGGIPSKPTRGSEEAPDRASEPDTAVAASAPERGEV